MLPALETFIAEFEEATEFAYDCETSGLFPFAEGGYITAIAIAFAHKTWVIPGFMHPDFQQSFYKYGLNDQYVLQQKLGLLLRTLFAVWPTSSAYVRWSLDQRYHYLLL